MAKVDGSQNLKDMFSSSLLIKTTWVLLELLQYSVVNILKYQVQFSFSSEHLQLHFMIEILTCENLLISLCKVGKVQRNYFFLIRLSFPGKCIIFSIKFFIVEFQGLDSVLYN